MPGLKPELAPVCLEPNASRPQGIDFFLLLWPAHPLLSLHPFSHIHMFAPQQNQVVPQFGSDGF